MAVVYAENAQIAGEMVAGKWGKRLKKLRKNHTAMTFLAPGIPTSRSNIATSMLLPGVPVGGDLVGKSFGKKIKSAAKKTGKGVAKVATSKAGIAALSFAAGAGSAVAVQKFASSKTGKNLVSKAKGVFSSSKPTAQDDSQSASQTQAQAAQQTAQHADDTQQSTPVRPVQSSGPKVSRSVATAPAQSQNDDDDDGTGQNEQQADDNDNGDDAAPATMVDRRNLVPASAVNAAQIAPAAAAGLPRWLLIALLAGGAFLMMRR